MADLFINSKAWDGYTVDDIPGLRKATAAILHRRDREVRAYTRTRESEGISQRELHSSRKK